MSADIMSETEFHRLADHQLTLFSDALEAVDSAGQAEVEVQNGAISIRIGSRTWLISKHTPSRQLWLSSPISGGLHFSYDPIKKQWGRLSETLFAELRTAGAEVA